MRILISVLSVLALTFGGQADAQWRTHVTYPPKALREGREGTAYFTATIDKEGRVKDCTITKSSGSADLDEATCRTFSEQARFAPATDAAGNAIEGTFSSKLEWKIH